jgi:C_GCAxxG_C_C family probable redox protein
MSSKAEEARRCHAEGYNCCMSVVKPFIKEMDVDQDQVIRIASSLGGGLGYLREVCGAVSGMAVVVGLKYGYLQGFKDEDDKKAKAEHYALVKQLGEKFKEKTGALTCRALLHLDENDKPLPGYENMENPCPHLVETAAEILSEYIASRESK